MVRQYLHEPCARRLIGLMFGLDAAWIAWDVWIAPAIVWPLPWVHPYSADVEAAVGIVLVTALPFVAGFAWLCSLTVRRRISVSDAVAVAGLLGAIPLAVMVAVGLVAVVILPTTVGPWIALAVVNFPLTALGLMAAQIVLMVPPLLGGLLAYLLARPDGRGVSS